MAIQPENQTKDAPQFDPSYTQPHSTEHTGLPASSVIIKALMDCKHLHKELKVCDFSVATA